MTRAQCDHVLVPNVYVFFSRLETISIQSFIKPMDGLPDPKGLFPSRLPSQAIALAIKELEKVTTSEKGKKRCQDTWITDQQGSKRNDKHSALLDRRFFLSRVQKINAVTLNGSTVDDVSDIT